MMKDKFHFQTAKKEALNILKDRLKIHKESYLNLKRSYDITPNKKMRKWVDSAKGSYDAFKFIVRKVEESLKEEE